MNCPRCSAPEKKLMRDLDPDYRYCIGCHHTVYVNTPLDLPLVPPREGMSLNRKDLITATCMDCGSVVHQGSKRCAPCAAVARGYANRGGVPA